MNVNSLRETFLNNQTVRESRFPQELNKINFLRLNINEFLFRLKMIMEDLIIAPHDA